MLAAAVRLTMERQRVASLCMQKLDDAARRFRRRPRADDKRERLKSE